MRADSRKVSSCGCVLLRDTAFYNLCKFFGFVPIMDFFKLIHEYLASVFSSLEDDSEFG